MKNTLLKAKNSILTYDNKIIELDNISNIITTLLENSYSTPSYVIANEDELLNAKEKGLWLEFEFEEVEKFKDFEFESLLITIKPKYNFLTLYRKTNGTYNGKCINLNLSNSTTGIFKEIMKSIKDKIWEVNGFVNIN